MDDAPATDVPATDAPAAAPLDPTSSDPRELMRALLPPARAEYIKAWELLADNATKLERRRAARDRAKAIATDHALVAGALRERESTLKGDDLLNARHLADELERHADALTRIAEVSPVGLHTAQSLRPEALGCGKRYRDPSKQEGAAPAGATRGGANKPSSSDRDKRDRDRGRRQGGGRPFEDRGPKVSRDALGSSKHDSQLGDDLDPAVREKLEAMRKALES